MDKTFDAADAEPRLIEAWERAGAFRAGANASRAETFCVMIPPPNVTGSLHVGHALNNTLQDILVRWHRMRGFDTLWQPGQDHAGIATQMVVERELARSNRRRTDMSRKEFTDLVWAQKERSGGTIIEQLKRLGASCDWSRNAFTMAGAPGDTRVGHESSPDFHAAVIKTFVDLYERGIVYRGKRLVNWDPQFETAISDLEVENVETPGHMWHFRYPLAGGETYEYVERDEDGAERFRETRDYIAIATTRPETMLGDGAVAVHPSDERYAPIVGRLCEIPVGPREHRRQIPIITDEYPDPAFGSGAVKITGAHDFNDHAVATRNGIPLYRLMDTRAAMRSDGLPYEEAARIAGEIARGEREAGDVEAVNLVPEDLRGLDRLEARARVVEQITAEGLAVMVPSTDPRLGPPAKAKPGASGGEAPGRARGAASDDGHAPAPEPGRGASGVEAPDQVRGAGGTSTPVEPEEGGEARASRLVPLVEPKLLMQPMGDRSKVVIEPMLTDQWFVDTARIVQPAIDSVREGMARPEGSTAGTRILPEQDAKVYFNWLENIEPWCISRQLWWGHRIPVWYGPRKVMSGDQMSLSYTPGAMKQFCAPTERAARAAMSDYYEGRSVVELYGFSEAREEAEQRFGSAAMISMIRRSEAADEDLRNAVPVFRDPDVLDTWFSSALWPMGTLGWPEDTPELRRYFPTDVLVTGFDIIFFWVARMMMMSHAVLNPDGKRDPEETKPFHTVYVHALVRDEAGQKMSKSKGNVVDPLDLIDRYGADALRFTLAASASLGRDVRLAESRVEGHRNFATKLWNAARFARLNDARFDAGRPEATLTVNRWIISETARVREAVDEALQAYRFNDAASTLYAFVWGRVCDWYLELAKPLLAGDGAEETRAVMGWVIDQCLILLHPIMPFVTEALWEALADRPKMLVHADWPTYGAEITDDDATRETEWVIALIEAVRSARGEMGVPGGRQGPHAGDRARPSRARVPRAQRRADRPAGPDRVGRPRRRHAQGRGDDPRAGRPLRPAARRRHRRRRRARAPGEVPRQARPRARRAAGTPGEPPLRRERPRGRRGQGARRPRRARGRGGQAPRRAGPPRRGRLTPARRAPVRSAGGWATRSSRGGHPSRRPL